MKSLIITLSLLAAIAMPFVVPVKPDLKKATSEMKEINKSLSEFIKRRKNLQDSLESVSVEQVQSAEVQAVLQKIDQVDNEISRIKTRMMTILKEVRTYES